jgi:redox-sensitive bicupin YhaK (pirin superfamily)
LRAGGTQRFETPAGSTVLVYGMTGDVRVDGERLDARHLRVRRAHVGSLALEATGELFEGIILAALPLGEPVVSRGPFVMNTRREIERAYEEYVAGTLGVDALEG